MRPDDFGATSSRGQQPRRATALLDPPTKATIVDEMTSRLGLASTSGNPLVATLQQIISGYPITPVERHTIEVEGLERHVWLKLEGLSPWNSLKGRTAIGLVISALHRLRPGSHIVESTSGNLGVALASLAQVCGLRFTAVVDELLPTAFRSQMMGQGTACTIADPGPGPELERRLATVKRLIAEDPSVVWLNQYENPANPLIHEIWTGPELLQQVPEADAVFVAASTGGTLAGVVRAAEQAGHPCEVVGVDVYGSKALIAADGVRFINGMGASRPSRHVAPGMCDAVRLVQSWEGVDTCRAFGDATGRRLGGSGGAVLVACLSTMAERPELRDVLCLCPDLGWNYGGTVYNDAWVDERRPATAYRSPTEFGRTRTSLEYPHRDPTRQETT